MDGSPGKESVCLPTVHIFRHWEDDDVIVHWSDIGENKLKESICLGHTFYLQLYPSFQVLPRLAEYETHDGP